MHTNLLYVTSHQKGRYLEMDDHNKLSQRGNLPLHLADHSNEGLPLLEGVAQCLEWEDLWEGKCLELNIYGKEKKPEK